MSPNAHFPFLSKGALKTREKELSCVKRTNSLGDDDVILSTVVDVAIL